MRDINRAVLAAAGIILAPAGAVSAHIVLSQPTFEAGQNYAVFFKVEQGCDGSPTLALNVQIPGDVIVLDTPSKPGWAVSAKRDKGQVTGVTWRGKLAAKDSDQFGLFVKLPAKPGPLYFPVLQQCEKGEIRWSDIPVAGQAPRDVLHPAPVLQLIAAAQPATSTSHYMVGDIMIEQPWAPGDPAHERRDRRRLHDHHESRLDGGHIAGRDEPSGKTRPSSNVHGRWNHEHAPRSWRRDDSAGKHSHA